MVLGMGPTALAIVRGLGRAGVTVYGIALYPSEVSLRSTYCRPLGAIDPLEEPERLCRRLEQFAHEHPAVVKVLYPSGDECVAFISEHYDRLRKHYRFYDGLAPQIVAALMNKKTFHEVCRAAGVDTARTEFPGDMAQAQALAQSMPYPCLLKPIEGHRWRGEFGLLKALVCRGRDEYLANLRRVAHILDNIMVQEIIPGGEENICSLIVYIDRNGRAVGGVTTQKLRQFPPGFGTGCAVLSASKPQIVAPSLRLLEAAKFHGMVEVEFKYCPRDRTYKALDVNTRPCRLGGLAEACGSTALVASFLDLGGLEMTLPPTRQKYGIKWLFWIRDMVSVVRGLPRGRFGLGEVIDSYSRPRTWCIYASDDPRPFFAYFLECASKCLKVAWKKVRRRWERWRE